jgi:hypothetical protein
MPTRAEIRAQAASRSRAMRARLIDAGLPPDGFSVGRWVGETLFASRRDFGPTTEEIEAVLRRLGHTVRRASGPGTSGAETILIDAPEEA